MDPYSLIARRFLAVLMPPAILIACIALTPESTPDADLGSRPREGTRVEFEIYMLSPEELFDEEKSTAWCGGPEGLVISIDDVVKYRESGHHIVLTTSAANRLADQELAGNPFVVCVDHEPIYYGEFMAAYMSRSSNGVVILWPSIEDAGDRLSIQLGYPGLDFFTEEDPRSDPRILDALRRAGKLE